MTLCLSIAAVRGDDQHWELLPAQAAFSLRVGNAVHGFQPFPAFPQWLGKYSSTGKSLRLTKEIVEHSSLSINQGFNAVRLDYIPYLRTRLLNQLLPSGSKGIDGDMEDKIKELVLILDNYGLSKDDFTETMKDLQFTFEKDPLLKDRYEEIDSKVMHSLYIAYWRI
jgi:replication factor C subunit 1